MREAGSRGGPLTLAAGLAPLVLGIFAIGTNLFIVVPLLPAIRHDFPVAGAADLGQLLVSAYALPYALLAPALGPLSDRVGRVPIMVGGMALLGLAAIISAWAPTLAVLAAARGVAGIGAALFTPAAYAHIGDRYPYERRERAMAVVLAGLPMATVVGVPAAGLLAAAGSWRWGLGAVSVVAALGLLSLMRVKAHRPSRRAGHWSLIWASCRDGRAMLAVAVSFLWFAAGLGLFTFMGEYLFSLFGFGAGARALAVGAYGVMGLCGSLAGVRFAALAGKRAAVLLGLSGLCGVFLLVALNRISGVLALLTMAAWGAASWFGMPSQQAIVSELRPAARGTMLALNNSAMYLGATLGAAIIGKALDRAGFAAAGWLAAGIVAGAALITALGVRERAPAAIESGTSRPLP
jgi:predicted MFS family arabinose efflux permease